MVVPAPAAGLQRPEARPLIVAHRGGRWPETLENTLPAYRQGLEAGADAVECDVRLGTDGVLFLHHERQLPDGRLTEQLSRREREAQDIPDLDELLVLMERWPQRGLVLEAKTRAASAALLERVAPTPQRLLISFSDQVVVQAAAGWRTGYLQAGGPELARDLNVPGGLLGPAAAMAFAYSDEELARANVWTVNDLLAAELLAARGVWALTSDYPALLLRHLQL